MKPIEPRLNRGFTLIELLVVIAIIVILAAMLLPVLSRVKRQARISQAKLEANGIKLGISKYDSDYSHWPVSVAAQAAASNLNPGEDFTFGGPFGTPDGGTTIIAVPGLSYSANNSEVVCILMDLTTHPSGVNATHDKNPKKIRYLDARMASEIGKPGIGPDLVYRDPWGNPYVITLDLNNDENAKDAFYRLRAVSQSSGQTGLKALINSSNPSGNSDDFELRSAIMVWSAGPNGMVDQNGRADQGANEDNVLSWVE